MKWLGRRGRGTRWALIVTAVCAALLLLDTGAIWFRLDREGVALSGSAAGGTTYLLIGSDERVDVPDADRASFGSSEDVPGARADIVVLVRVDDDGSVRTLAVPRDLLIARRGHGVGRLAMLLQYGPEGITDALCSSLGIGVDHVVTLRFDGLRSLVDFAGGIDIRSDAVLVDRNSGIELQKGSNHLDGAGAIAYVRARHLEELHRDGTSTPATQRNLERSQRAAEVIDATARGLDVDWWNPVRVQQLAWTVSGAVAVDDGTGPFDLLGLRGAARNIDRASLQVLPTVHTDGEIPVDELAPGAAGSIAKFNGPGRPPVECRSPALELARR